MTDNAPGRNDPCHCGSGKKYKHCCLAKDEEEARQARAKAEAEAVAKAAAEAGAKAEAATAESPKSPAPGTPPAPVRTEQPWKRKAQNTRGFSRVSAPRRSGGS